jgi:hypothetical protein
MVVLAATCSQALRNAFVQGILSNVYRQRCLMDDGYHSMNPAGDSSVGVGIKTKIEYVTP